jgi:hypothetical protein
MVEDQNNRSRRTVLKGIAAGTAVAWAAPTVTTAGRVAARAASGPQGCTCSLTETSYFLSHQDGKLVTFDATYSASCGSGCEPEVSFSWECGPLTAHADCSVDPHGGKASSFQVQLVECPAVIDAVLIVRLRCGKTVCEQSKERRWVFDELCQFVAEP